MPTEEEVAAGFGAKHPGSSLEVRGRDLRRRARHAVDPDRVGQRARHRRTGRRRRPRRVRRPVARPRPVPRGSRLRPQPVRPGGGRLLQARTTARSASRSPSTRRCSGTRPTCSRRSGSSEPPHEYGDEVHDARRHRGRLELRHDPRAREAPDGRQERQGRHRPGLRSRRTSSSTASSRSATTCAGLGAYWGAGNLVGGRRQDGRDPGRLGGRLEVLATTASGRTTSS